VAKEMVKIGKKVTTNENGLGIELELKNSKAQSCDIEVVVCVNKMSHPLMEKSDFLRMNLRIMSISVKGIWIVKLGPTLFVGTFATFVWYGDHNL
jgi:hypothetical protein